MNTPSRRHFLTQASLLTGAFAVWPQRLQAEESRYQTNPHYAANRAPLLRTPYVALPLGSVHAKGWLLKQLELQRDGLTGHAEELLPALKPDSGWLGGEGEDWEKGPYYLKGLVPLAYQLRDEALIKRAQRWIEAILASQRPDGFFGPKKNDDWWPRMVATYALRDYYEATKDERVITLQTKYYQHLLGALPQRPLREWGRARAGDEIDTIFWLYNRTGIAALLDTAALLRKQAYDWRSLFTKNTLLSTDGGEMVSHNVNVPQALKMPVVVYQQTKDVADREAAKLGDQQLMRDHGLGVGINSGTEHLAGRSPTQGIETCSTVEKMLSLETNLRILGDASLGDDLERLAFNALPGAFSDEIKHHVYYSRPNNVVAQRHDTGFWQNYDNGTMPGPMSGFPCCCYNLHMGWPKYVQNAYAATHDQGLAVLAYGPSEVTAKVGHGVVLTLTQTTDYPFREEIHFKITTPETVRFPLELRIPAWCQQPSIRVGGTLVADCKPGTFCRIEREWASGDEVVVKFPMEVRAVAGVNQSLQVELGALIFSLEIKARKKIAHEWPNGFDEHELFPESPWNYALALDAAKLGTAIRVEQSPMPTNPFVQATTPLKLKLKARRVPEWTLAWNQSVAFDPPYSPVTSQEPAEEISLVPYGSEYLRITQFPVLGQSVAPARSFRDGFDDTQAVGWLTYRGGWWVEDGCYHCTSGQAGGKSVAMGTNFGDFMYEAEVAVGASGNAGIIFRAKDFGVGTDEYHGYYVGIDPAGGELVAGLADGNYRQLAATKRPLMIDHLHHLRVVAKGTTFEVFLDRQADPVLTFTDSSLTHGAIGVRQYLPNREKGRVKFDNIFVQAS